ncbi:MAG TPA: hypothetical protein VJ583_05835 [Nitrososphaeraceae archaeon]|nr:hypothetical protein [Nitrososphaeraceae archaeon]
MEQTVIQVLVEKLLVVDGVATMNKTISGGKFVFESKEQAINFFTMLLNEGLENNFSFLEVDNA